MKPGWILTVACTWFAPFAAAQDAEASCRVCHPGAVRALADGPHSQLLARADLAGKVCASCHGDLSQHAAADAGSAAPPVPPVARATCATCHADADLDPARGTHPLRVVGSGAPPLATATDERLERLRAEAADPDLVWSGLTELGYRFVHHRGSRTGFDTDLDLDPGLRLRDFELRGTGSDAAAIDEVLLRADDIGDPRWGADLTLAKADVVRVRSTYRSNSYTFATTGDFHRVDRDSRTWATSLELGNRDAGVFLSHRREEDDGYWLTQRIGNRNLLVQTVVDGVDSPRHRHSDEGEIGVRGGTALRWTVAVGAVRETARDRWSYSQPATANPSFVESEDLRSTSDAAGPTARIELAHTGDLVSVRFTGNLRALDRDVDGSGSGAGFDTAAFTTSTASAGSGDSRWLEWHLDADCEVVPTVRLGVASRLRDYRERLRLHEVDVRTTTSPSSVVTTTTDVDDETVQRLFDADVHLAWNPTPDVTATIGYGFAREQLRVPDLQPADPLDFRRGHTRDSGVLAGLRWRFAEQWTLRLDGRDFATDGILLHETTAENARGATGSLAWRGDAAEATLFARHRHADNDVTDHRYDSFATGLNASCHLGEVTFAAGYTYADTESRTRTNFYFDPDPDPRPTVVGFHGETHVWTASSTWDVTPAVQAILAATATRTVGAFDVRGLDLSAEVRWSCNCRGTAAIEYRHAAYGDQIELDDWAADLLFVSWRQTW
ncbi:MAG: hypothetical protein U1E73_00970 [Planctomycetota bacterium]